MSVVTGSYDSSVMQLMVGAVQPLELYVSQFSAAAPTPVPPPPSGIVNPIALRPSNINRISINAFNVNAPRVVIRSN